MKQKYGIAYLEKIKKEVETAEDNELFTRDVSGERESNQSVIDKAKQEGIATGEVTEDGEEIKEEITLDNPADKVNGNRAKGILLLVTEQNADISEAAVNSNEYVSYEKPGQKGNGLAGREDISTGETLLFDAYILEKCGNYSEPKEEGILKYQAEYVLFGKNNDVDNLKAAVHRLLLLREVSNVAYLFSDGGKCAEAEALATTICTAAGAPILIEPVKISLLFAWAYAEAIYDVRELLAGGRIPLMKSAKSWHYSLENMLLAGQDSKGAESNETGQRNQNIADGLSYSDYLRVFLAVSGQEQKIYRMMDIVEMDVRKASNHRQFYLKNCVDYLNIQACVGSKFGYYHEMERSYYYE
jgi:hypothetical protein